MAGHSKWRLLDDPAQPPARSFSSDTATRPVTGLADAAPSAIISELPFVILLVLLTALRVIGQLDVLPWDEADYVRSGLALASGAMVPWSDFPGHAGIFSIASLFISDTVNVYFVGRVFTSVLFVMASWLVVRMVSGSTPALICASLVAGLSTPYSSIGSGQTGAALLAVGLVLILRNKSLAQSVTGSVVLWMATTARLEYLPAAVVGSIVVMWLSGQRARQVLSNHTPSQKWRAALLLVVTSTLVLIVPTLMLVSPAPLDSGRLWLTFGQHYATGQGAASPASGLEWESVLAKSFPGAHSITQAAIASPGQFASHMLRNLPRIPQRLIVPGMINPSASAAGLLVNVLAAAALLGCAVLPLVNAGKRVIERRGLTESRKSMKRYVVALPALTAAITNIGILVVIYPETHYLSPWVPFIAIGAGIGLERWMTTRQLLKFYAATILTVVLALTVNGMGRAMFPPSRPMADAVSSIRSLQGSPRVLSGYWGFSVYAPSATEICPTDVVDKDSTSFAEFLAREQVSVILIDDSLDLGEWSQLPGYESFIEDPTAFGFKEYGETAPLWVLLPETASP